ncbi:MAG: hypothetical protein ACRETW_01160, partial [Stenotrophobium sp.]
MPRLLPAVFALSATAFASGAVAHEGPEAVERHYTEAPPAPRTQSAADAQSKSAGCVTCHAASDAKTMHPLPGVVLGCADCHGGDAAVLAPVGATRVELNYIAAMDKAHVLPRFPTLWPGSAKPKESYTLLNREAPEFIRFVNPGDYRAAHAACGACHLPIVEAAERSLMSTAAMFFGGASYNNGVLPYKRYILGESYTEDGQPAAIKGPV